MMKKDLTLINKFYSVIILKKIECSISVQVQKLRFKSEMITTEFFSNFLQIITPLLVSLGVYWQWNTSRGNFRMQFIYRLFWQMLCCYFDLTMSLWGYGADGTIDMSWCPRKDTINSVSYNVIAAKSSRWTFLYNPSSFK